MMSYMYTDSNLYNLLDQWVFSRELPEGMKLSIEKGAEVNVDSVIATGYMSTIDYMMNIDPKINKKDIISHHGQIIRKGDIIVKDKLVSPIDGIVNLSRLPQLSIESIPEYVEIKSLIKGRVIGANLSKVDIVSKAVRFFLPFVFGMKVQGKFLHVGDINSFTYEEDETIIVTEFADKGFESKGKAIGIKGIVGVGIDVAFAGDKHNNLTVGSICGFGNFTTVFDFDQWNGYFCEINGNNSSFVISVNN